MHPLRGGDARLCWELLVHEISHAISSSQSDPLFAALAVDHADVDT
jgi:hypothetical protein